MKSIPLNTKAEAEEALSNCMEFVSFEHDSEKVLLDGLYTPEELEALAFLLREHIAGNGEGDK